MSEDNKEEYPFLTQKGYEIIKKHTTPRTYIGMGRYASYKEYGEEIWRIGYGSKKLGRRWVGAFEKADQKQVDEQLFEDLKELEIKRDNPERRKNFRARHNCDEKKSKMTAGYWSCKMW